MSTAWQPQPQLLQEVLSLLQAYLVPNNDVQRQSYLQLQQYQQNLEFNLYLVHVLCATDLEPNVRQVAGLLLKRNIKAADVGGTKAPDEMTMLAIIRARVLQVLADDTHAIRNTAGSIVTTFVSQYTFLDEWPELVPTLSSYLDQQDENAIAGAFGALCKMCEDSAAKLENSPSRPLTVLIPKFMQYLRHNRASFRRDALDCLNNVLIYLPVGLVMDMQVFLEGISVLTQDQSAEVRKLVCKSIVILLEVGVNFLLPHLDNIVQFILRASQDTDESVAIEAIEFWAAFCDVPQFDQLKGALQPYLPQIVPLLFERMVYSEEELATFEAEEQSQNENVPDRPEDVKPIFHHRTTASSGAGAGELVDDDDDDDDDDDGYDEDDDDSMLQWNLRRCSASSLDTLANGYGNEILPTLLPLLQARLALQEPWPLVESGILTLGAVADGCYEGIAPHLHELFPYLLQKLENPAPLIRSISCWTLSRYATWVCEQTEVDKYLRPLVEALLRRVLDPHKKVQEAACSAMCTLEEEAREQLVPFMTPILQNLLFAFGKYQAKNMLILYDAIGTLADSVGTHLNNPEFVAILMPPLIAKWNAIDDRDREILPLFECFASIAQALGNGFQEYAMTVYVRCLRVTENELLADALHDQNPDDCEEGDPDFIVCALDLIAGMLEGLGPNSAALVANSNLLNLLQPCVQHDVLDVRQSVMGIVGYLARYAREMLLPGLRELLPLLIENMDPDTPTTCHNAMWSMGEIAVCLGAEMAPYVDRAFAPLLEMVNRAKLPRNLIATCAVTIGQLSMVCPAQIAAHLPELTKRWCRALVHVKAVREREHCLMGICCLVQANPQAIVPDFMYVCGAIAALEPASIPNPQLQEMLSQIMQGFKTSVGENWPQYFATFPEPLRRFLTAQFQL